MALRVSSSRTTTRHLRWAISRISSPSGGSNSEWRTAVRHFFSIKSKGKKRLLAGEDAHAFVIEDKGFDLGFGALGRDLGAVPEEADGGGVADAHRNLMIGAHRGVRWSDQVFLSDGLSIGGDRDEAVFRSPDHERERGLGCDSFRGRPGGRWSGGVIVDDHGLDRRSAVFCSRGLCRV